MIRTLFTFSAEPTASLTIVLEGLRGAQTRPMIVSVTLGSPHRLLARCKAAADHRDF